MLHKELKATMYLLFSTEIKTCHVGEMPPYYLHIIITQYLLTDSLPALNELGADGVLGSASQVVSPWHKQLQTILRLKVLDQFSHERQVRRAFRVVADKRIIPHRSPLHN